MSIAVALDGPAGAGKSSIAKRAAKALDFIYVDTGALYRTIGLAATRRGVEPAASPEVDALLGQIAVDLTFNEKGEQVVLTCSAIWQRPTTSSWTAEILARSFCPTRRSRSF